MLYHHFLLLHYYHWISGILFSSVQSLSCVWLFATPWAAAHQPSLFITNFRSLLKLMSIESVIPSNHLILCHPPPAFSPSSVKIFSSELVLCIMAKALELQLQHQSFKRIFKTDFFRIDWFDILAVQETLESFIQHHSSVTCSNSHLLISFSLFNFVWNLSVLFFSSFWHYS